MGGNSTCIGLELEEKLGVLYLTSCLALIVLLTGRRLTYTLIKKHSSGLSFADFITCTAIIVACCFAYLATILATAGTGSMLVCTLGIFLCIIFYTASKGTVYLLFMEKAYQAHRGFTNTDRLKSRLYQVNVFLFSLYGILFVLMIVFRIHEIVNPYEQGLCLIGIASEASVPLVIYDTFFSVYLTTLFLVPVIRSMRSTSHQGNASLGSSRTRDTVRRNLIGMSIATLSSGLNILSLALLPKQRLVVCLSLCTTDVVINCLVIHYTIRMKRLYILGDTSRTSQTGTYERTSEVGFAGLHKICPRDLEVIRASYQSS